MTTMHEFTMTIELPVSVGYFHVPGERETRDRRGGSPAVPEEFEVDSVRWDGVVPPATLVLIEEAAREHYREGQKP